jgi:hypothetical protein
MCETYLEEFKREMEPAKEIYTKEIKEFAKKYEFLDNLRIFEEPDIQTQEYIFAFEKLNGTSKEVLNTTLEELYIHMEKFSKENGIDEFERFVTITFNGDLYEN